MFSYGNFEMIDMLIVNRKLMFEVVKDIGSKKKRIVIRHAKWTDRA